MRQQLNVLSVQNLGTGKVDDMEKKKIIGKIVENLEGRRYEMSPEILFISKFYLPLTNSGYFEGPLGINQRWEDGKTSALTAINEIIDVLDKEGYDEEDSKIIRWMELKDKIINLDNE